jgi:hypothetical protein
VAIGGNRGISDRVPFESGTDLVGYALVSQQVVLNRATEVIFEVMGKAGADDVMMTPVVSGDLEIWTSEGVTLKSQEPMANGMVRRLWRVAPGASDERFFFRLQLELR